MDQKKIGAFLKELRRERSLTQEQLAEELSVSARTVSRWETGSNMPDLAVLVELAEFYQVELKEILDGERKRDNMNEEMKETMLKVADYTGEDKKRQGRRICAAFSAGLTLFTLYLFLEELGIHIWVGDFSLGFAYGIMIAAVLYSSGLLAKMKKWKKK